MSRQNSEDATPDIYVALLFISVVALTTGCIFLALELNSYGWQFN